MKVLLIVWEVIILSGLVVFYTNLKAQDTTAKRDSETVMIAEAVPPDRGSPDTRGKGKGRGNSFQDDRTKEVKSC